MRNFLLIGTFCFMAMFCSANSTSSIQYSQIRKVAVSDLSQLTNTFAIVNEDSTWVELVTPPVADQDTVHNCVGWSMCYANASIICYNETQDWNTALRSPSFNFNRVKESNVDTDYHWETRGMDLGRDMHLHGVPSYNLFPPTLDVYLVPNQVHCSEAALTKLQYDRLNDLSDISEYKAILKKGYPISVTATKGPSFDNMWNNSCIWDSIDPKTPNKHMTTIIGYDDSTQRFKVMNSYGTSNLGHGFYWVTYDNVRNGCYEESYVFELESFGNIDIVGSSEMCDSTYYYVSNLPDSASLSWGHLSIGSGSPIYHVVVDDTTAIYNRSLDLRDDVISSPLAILPPIEPRTYVTATISLDTSAVTLQKRVKLPYNAAPRISCPETTLSVNKRVTFTEERFSSEADSSIVWNIIFRPALGTEDSTTAYGHHIQYTPPKIGRLFVTARRLIGCPENDSKTVSYFVLARKLQIVSVSAECLNFESLSDEKYDIFIYDLQGNMLTSTHAYGEIFSIPCGVFSNRPFMVVAIQNGEEVLRQIIPSVH